MIFIAETPLFTILCYNVVTHTDFNRSHDDVIKWKHFPRYWGGCFTKVSRALQNNLAKICNARNHIYDENFKMKLCMCALNHALDIRTKFQLEILSRNMVPAIHTFRENILESSQNVCETPQAFCAGNPPVTGEFSSQRSVTVSFDVSFDLCLNKRLSK